MLTYIFAHILYTTIRICNVLGCFIFKRYFFSVLLKIYLARSKIQLHNAHKSNTIRFFTNKQIFSHQKSIWNRKKSVSTSSKPLLHLKLFTRWHNYLFFMKYQIFRYHRKKKPLKTKHPNGMSTNKVYIATNKFSALYLHLRYRT